MPDRPGRPTDLRAALHGTVGFVLDADGVIILKGEPLPGSIDALAQPRRPGHPVSSRHELLPRAPNDAGGAIRRARHEHRPEPDHHGGLGDGRLHRRPRSPDATCSRSWRPMRDASSRGSGSSARSRPRPHPTSIARRGHRRRRRRPVLREPGHRVPAHPRRGGVPGDASQPVVVDPQGPHARRRCRRRRPRIRDGPHGDGPRQAVAGRSSGWRSRDCAPISVAGCRRVRSRWSATTRSPMSVPRNGPASAASSC